MNKIIVVGLGAGDLDQMSIGTYRLLKNHKKLYIRTKEHPVIKSLEEEGLVYHSFDDIYEQNEEFQQVYQQIVTYLFEQLKNNKEIVYAVPGHPFVAEKTVQLLIEQSEENQCFIEFSGGQSFLDPIFTTLKIDPIEGFQMVDASGLNEQHLQVRNHIFITQVYDAFIASEVKLSLMGILPDDYDVYIVTAAGSSEEVVKKVPLFELDRNIVVNNLTSVYVPPVKDEEILYYDFYKLREVIAILRGPNGCPWDQKQTHHTLKKYLIEEAYEVLDAIDEENDENLIEELGDVLLQVMLHSQIGEDAGYFTIQDVVASVTEKMIRRHPHVFADAIAETSEEVVSNWEDIKSQEKNDKEKSLLDGIPAHLPGLYRAHELQSKAASIGFDWDEVSPMWDKMLEEMNEFKIEVSANDREKLEKEFGDMLFALVNIGRFYKIDPEEAIRQTNRKFFKRFNFIEETVKKQGLDIRSLSLEQLDEIWEEAKKYEK